MGIMNFAKIINKVANIFKSDEDNNTTASELIYRPPTPSDTDETGMKIAKILSSNLLPQYGFKTYDIQKKVTSILPNLICYDFSTFNRFCFLHFYAKESITVSELHVGMFSVKTYSCKMNSKYYTINTIQYDLDFSSNTCCIVSNNRIPVDQPVFTHTSGDTYLLMKSLKDNKYINTTTNVISKATNTVNKENLIDEDFVRSMDWRDFEIWVANVFNSNGYNARTTKPTNDGGKDVIATKAGETYYIECKHWDENATIGRELLQKLVGSAAGANVKHIIFIATCQYNDNAKEYAKSLNAAEMMTIELWGMEEILSLANSRNAQQNKHTSLPPLTQETIEQNLFANQESLKPQSSVSTEQIQYKCSPAMERAIEQAAIENVMKLTGMTCEDLEALKYLDKNDERVKTFQYSKDFAKAMEQAITIKTMQTIGMTEEEFLALEYLDENDERVKLFQNTKEAVRASFAKSFNNVIKANQSSA